MLPSGTCNLTQEAYDPFDSGDGADCPPTQVDNECYSGDLCNGDGLCQPVRSIANLMVPCALLALTYDPIDNGNGVDCPPSQVDNECHAGDRCTAAGLCKPVKSASQTPVFTSLLGRRYDPIDNGTGADCPPTQVDNECWAGDRCEGGQCVVVLSALGGTVNEAIIGSKYTPIDNGTGVDCPATQVDNECLSGDRCLPDGTCEVVLSAKM